jgi:ankyrin repeat protein
VTRLEEDDFKAVARVAMAPSGEGRRGVERHIDLVLAAALAFRPDVRTPTIEYMPGELSDDELAFLHRVLDLAREGRTTELADVIEGGVPVNLTGATGDSLLILAAYHDHPSAVRMLLERGADPNRVNDRGQTALGAAVFRRSTESATALLEHGADPHAGGRSAVEIAAFFELEEMTALLTRSRA